MVAEHIVCQRRKRWWESSLDVNEMQEATIFPVTEWWGEGRRYAVGISGGPGYFGFFKVQVFEKRRDAEKWLKNRGFSPRPR